jgi:hypothetical protein
MRNPVGQFSAALLMTQQAGQSFFLANHQQSRRFGLA